MFRVDAGLSPRYCDGLNRRSFVQLGAAGLASMGLSGMFRQKAQAAEAGRGVKNTSAILLWLDGGPSHMDLYDLKPKAPQEYRGFWNPIATNVPGFDIGELLPKQAQIALELEGKPGTAMAAFGKQLSDTELAAVITYTRNAWGNKSGEVIQPAEVKAQRK